MPIDAEAQRVLLIDDNRDSADAMAELMDFIGYDTQKAYGGVEAINIAAWFSPHVNRSNSVYTAPPINP